MIRGSSSSLRIGINARFLQYPSTGSGQHLEHLLRAFAARGDGNQYEILGPGPRVRLHSADQVEPLVASYQDSRAPTAMAERVQRLVWEQFGLIRAAREVGVDRKSVV